MPKKELNETLGKRAKILNQIKHLGKMRKASLSKQEYKKPDGTKQGPYYMLQGYNEKGEHYSQRIPDDMVPAIQKEIENYKKYQKLTDELNDMNIDDSFFKK